MHAQPFAAEAVSTRIFAGAVLSASKPISERRSTRSCAGAASAAVTTIKPGRLRLALGLAKPGPIPTIGFRKHPLSKCPFYGWFLAR